MTLTQLLLTVCVKCNTIIYHNKACLFILGVLLVLVMVPVEWTVMACGLKADVSTCKIKPTKLQNSQYTGELFHFQSFEPHDHFQHISSILWWKWCKENYIFGIKWLNPLFHCWFLASTFIGLCETQLNHIFRLLTSADVYHIRKNLCFGKL